MAVTTSNTQPSQYVQELLTKPGTGLYPQMTQALRSPYQQYGGPRVAGFSQDQQDAMGMARQSVGATDPNEARSADLMQQSYGALTGGNQQSQNLLDQSVSSGSDWLTKALSSAETMTSQGNPLLQEALGLTRQSAVGPSASGIQQYMDPYQQNVIDTTMSELNRQDTIAQQGRNAQAVNSGAFGGGRAAVVDAEAGRNLADTKGRLLAQMNSQNYGQAMDTFQNQQGMQANAGNAVAGMGANEAGLQQNAIGQMFSGGRNLADLYGGAAGQQAGLTGQLAGGMSDLATKELGLGSFMREQDMSDISNLYNMGQRQQGQQQAGMDVGYQDFLRKRQYEDPRAKVSFASDIIRGAPSGSQTMSTTYQDPMSPLQAIAGLAPLAMAFA